MGIFLDLERQMGYSSLLGFAAKRGLRSRTLANQGLLLVPGSMGRLRSSPADMRILF